MFLAFQGENETDGIGRRMRLKRGAIAVAAEKISVSEIFRRIKHSSNFFPAQSAVWLGLPRIFMGIPLDPHLKLVGITGTNKTTTTFLVVQFSKLPGTRRD